MAIAITAITNPRLKKRCANGKNQAVARPRLTQAQPARTADVMGAGAGVLRVCIAMVSAMLDLHSASAGATAGGTDLN